MEQNFKYMYVYWNFIYMLSQSIEIFDVSTPVLLKFVQLCFLVQFETKVQ